MNWQPSQLRSSGLPVQAKLPPLNSVITRPPRLAASSVAEELIVAARLPRLVVGLRAPGLMTIWLRFQKSSTSQARGA